MNPNKNYCYIYIFFLALSIRVFTTTLVPVQFWEYELIAHNILKGKGFVFPHLGIVYRAYCEPFYPFLATIVYFLTNHNVLILELVQAIFSSLVAIVIYFCGRKLYGHRVACLSGILVALHPGSIIYTTKLHPLTFDTFFIALVLLAMLKLSNDFNWRNISLSGLVSGLCVLTRPTILTFLPLALIYIFKTRKITFLKGILYTIAFFAFAGIIFLPWGFRNYFKLGAFILTRSNAPYTFWLGNNPNFSGSSLDKSGDDIFDLAPQTFKEKIYNLDEISQNKEFLKDALSYIKEFPFRFIERTIKKLYYFWWFNPQAGLLYPKLWFILYKIFYIFVLVLGMFGIYLSYKEGLFSNRMGATIILFALLSISVTQSLFYIETRHRWAIEPLFLIFTAKGAISLLNTGRRNEGY